MLGWSAQLHGSADVCGSSKLMSQVGSSDACVREATFVEAEETCAGIGARLCTADEMMLGEGDPSACSYDSVFRWSWVQPDETNACPLNNQSRGVAGGSGRWYAFEPTTTNAFYEIQLRSESIDGRTFTIDGVYDEDAARLPGEEVTSYQRDDAAMLRWNATTNIQGRIYVHVASTSEDASYTMVPIAPPTYTWNDASPTRELRDDVLSETTFQGLGLNHNHSVTVTLNFAFPFFGLNYRQVWVTSFGMVLFERPTSSLEDGFHGVDDIHAAVAAAAGAFNFEDPRASVRSRSTATELEVAWYAPLFGSSLFSNVSMRLDANGSIGISWDNVDLSGGGSLDYRRKSLLEFDSLTRDSETHTAEAGGAEYAITQTEVEISNSNGDPVAYVCPDRVQCPSETDSADLAGRESASVMETSDAVTEVSVGPVWGGDENEGLALSAADVVYAVTFDPENNFTVRGVDFRPAGDPANDDVAVYHSNEAAQRDGQVEIDFESPTADDNALSLALDWLVWGPVVTIRFTNLEPDADYRLQVLMYLPGHLVGTYDSVDTACALCVY